MKYLITLVLLIPSLVLAVDDAAVQAIDSKASNASAKAEGNNSRIQALEAKDDYLENLINSIPAGPAGPQGISGHLGLAGKSCPANLAVVGFDINGNLICAAPWNIPADGVTISCTENYNQAEVENDLVISLAALQNDLQANIQPLGGQAGPLSYQITFDSVQITGSPSISAPLVEMTEAEPCKDAISVTANLPDVVINGTVDGTIIFAGTNIPLIGTYQMNIIGVTVDGLIRLLSPDLSGVSSSGAFDRVIDSFVLTVNTNVDTQFEGDGGTFADIFISAVEPYINDYIATFVESVLSAATSTIQPPVTVDVTVSP